MNIIVKGKQIDTETRCIHYHSELDIIAIKLKCCSTYYPCYYCHEEDADHNASVWEKDEFETAAVLCGKCKQELTINQYKSSNYICPHCQAAFNSRCSNHDHFYFEQ